MTTRILVLSYRSSCEDYCMGHVVSSSDSEFEIFDTESEDEATEFLARCLLAEKTREAGRNYASRDNYVYVNGVSKDTYIEDEEFEESEAKNAKLLAGSIALRAQQEFAKKLALHEKAEAEAAEKAEAILIEKQRLIDLRQLETLKKKLGVE